VSVWWQAKDWYVWLFLTLKVFKQQTLAGSASASYKRQKHNAAAVPTAVWNVELTRRRSSVVVDRLCVVETITRKLELRSMLGRRQISLVKYSSRCDSLCNFFHISLSGGVNWLVMKFIVCARLMCVTDRHSFAVALAEWSVGNAHKQYRIETLLQWNANRNLHSPYSTVYFQMTVCISRDPAWSVSHCIQSWTTVTGYSAFRSCCPISAVNKNLAAKCNKLLVTTVQQLSITKPDICWESRF